MTLVRMASLIGVALLVMVVNVVMSILYMVVYAYLIDPGHPRAYYDEHAKVAAPYCSIVAGMPLMFSRAFGSPDGGKVSSGSRRQSWSGWRTRSSTSASSSQRGRRRA